MTNPNVREATAHAASARTITVKKDFLSSGQRER